MLLENSIEFNDWLIGFYKERLNYFKKIGVGGFTSFKTKVTKKLIDATERRIIELTFNINLKRGVKNKLEADTSFTIGENLKLYNSNRSFIGNQTSYFSLKDLSQEQERIVDDFFKYGEENLKKVEYVYIDKYKTAYNSEIMQLILLDERGF